MRTLLLRLCTIPPLLLAISTRVTAQSDCLSGQLPAYSHNDYENARPLADAVSLGFRGVEADVFLVDGALRVGHDKRSARNGSTLEFLYLRPLQELIARCAPVPHSRVSFVLAIELKERSPAAYDSLLSVLARHEALLRATRSAAAQSPTLMIVLVGWHPRTLTDNTGVDSLLGWQERISRSSVPAPLNARVQLHSIDYGKTIGRWWVTAGARRRWLAAIRAAKDSAPHVLVRAHNVPLDANVYTQLFDAGVDMIGTKQLTKTAELLQGR